MYDDDEPRLEGEFLRAVCAALSRNAIRGGGFAASAASDPYHYTPTRKLPKSVHWKTVSQSVEEAQNDDARH